jgi:WD40 repeat protein
VTGAARWITTAAVVLISSFAHRAMAEDLRKLVTISTPEKISTVSVCGTTGLVAGAAHDGAIHVWKLPSGEQVASWKSGAPVSALACSFDGKWLAIGDEDGAVKITDPAGKLVRMFAVAHAAVDSVAFAPDGSLLAVGTHENPVQLWNPGTGLRVAELHTDFSGSTSVDFAPDSSLVATADADTAVRIYDPKGKLKASYTGFLLEPFAISFRPNGKEIVVGGADSTLSILSAEDGQLIRRLPKSPDPIFNAVVLPGGGRVLSLQVDAATVRNFSLTLWNLGTNERRDVPVAGNHLIGYGEISNHQPVMFTVDSDSSLTAWAIPD